MAAPSGFDAGMNLNEPWHKPLRHASVRLARGPAVDCGGSGLEARSIYAGSVYAASEFRGGAMG
jgi:hypothetical protein